MTINIDKPTVFAFDLDDTLYKEIDFLKSAYKHISKLILLETNIDLYDEMLQLYHNNFSVFDAIKKKYSFSFSIEELVYQYRFHFPNLKIETDVISFLTKVKSKSPLTLITDGRSITQRNKLKALEIIDFFEIIVISEEIGSEKPDKQNFKIVEERFPDYNYVYIGDNYNKDFICPNNLGWLTIGLVDNGLNIHKQNSNLTGVNLPSKVVNVINEIELNYNY